MLSGRPYINNLNGNQFFDLKIAGIPAVPKTCVWQCVLAYGQRSSPVTCVPSKEQTKTFWPLFSKRRNLPA